jgi:hypothetical protein
MCTGTSSEATSLSALLADAHRHLAVADPSDDLTELAAALLAAADQHPAEAPALLILEHAIAGLIGAERPAAYPCRAGARVLAELTAS